jgi:type IV secretion system protein VirB10
MRPTILLLGALILPLHPARAEDDPQRQIDQLRTALSQLEQRIQAGNLASPGAAPLAAGSGAPSVSEANLPGSYGAYRAALQQLMVPGSPSPAVTPTPAAAPAKPAPAHPAPSGPQAKIPAGYVATGTLTMTVNSDYSGPWRGTLSQPIYSIDGSQFLFPEGTVVVGRVIRITGPNEAINNRLGLLPTTLVRPDGQAVAINQQAILDQLGISGIADQVDYHLGVQLAAIGAFTGLNSLPEIVAAQGGANATVQGTFFQLSSERGQILLNRYLTLLPTVTVRAGTEFRIFFSEEMLAPILRPRDRFELTNIGKGTP